MGAPPSIRAQDGAQSAQRFLLARQAWLLLAEDAAQKVSRNMRAARSLAGAGGSTAAMQAPGTGNRHSL